MTEHDPHGRSPHQPGAKLDAGKTGQWAGIKDDLVAAMKQKQEQQ